MDIGTGIMLAGVWVFAGLTGMSDKMTEFGWWISIAAALAVTGLSVFYG